MKVIEFKRDSWHHKLATIHDPYYNQDWKDETDICTYTRHVLLGFLSFLFMCGVFGLLAFFTLNSLYAVYQWVFFSQPMNEFAVVFLCVVGGLLTMGLLAGGTAVVREKLDSSHPGFVRTAYRSWKDKFCVKITFVDKNADLRPYCIAK